MVNQLLDDYAEILRLPLDNPPWAEFARIAALIVGANSRSFISLVPNNKHQAAICQLLQQKLVALIETAQLLSPIERAMCGKLLSQLGDPRPGVGVRADGIPDIVWCEVPTGEFLYQNGEHISLPTFKIAKYPVTCLQFQAFFDAPDGYNNLGWLKDLPEDWVRQWHKMERHAIERDKYLNSLSDDQRKNYHAEVNDWQTDRCWNQPRTMVSWEEATAFCRWLSVKLGVEVRLPTTQEWEKAARGPDGLIYPYGDQFDPTKANTRETAIGGTSAVGLFPDGASPYGVLDMSGNVFEWVLNDFDGRIKGDISNMQSPMFRGGAFTQSQVEARATFWDAQPSDKSANFGFRVVCPE